MTFEHVAFSYGEKAVFRDLSLTLPETGVWALTGPSGCGKTTLLRLIAGLERPHGGRIAGLGGKKIAYMFQEDRLLPWLTAGENIAAVWGKANADARDAKERGTGDRVADFWLDLVGVPDGMPGGMSGGMRRRVALARALAFNGDILLLDEPFTGVDEARKFGLIEQIRELYKERLIVLVTHEEEELRRFQAERIDLQRFV